jgi:hypothetical protein
MVAEVPVIGHPTTLTVRGEFTEVSVTSKGSDELGERLLRDLA